MSSTFNRTNEKNCCYKCNKRAVGCHDNCEDYKAWQDKKRAETFLYSAYIDYSASWLRGSLIASNKKRRKK